MQCPVTERECRSFQCLRLKGCRHQSASQPDPTPQDVAAPTLEQLAKSEISFELWQDDCCVATTEGENAKEEIMHYAMMYKNDGLIEVYEVHSTRKLIPHE